MRLYTVNKGLVSGLYNFIKHIIHTAKAAALEIQS